MNKKTAVEWLMNEIYRRNRKVSITDIIDQAMEMQKQQIIDAIKLTIEKEYTEQTWANCKSITDQAEQYYHQTYNNE
jgi:hypothetical protein